MEDVQLSTNFRLSQFTKSEAAVRHNFSEQFAPPEEVQRKLRTLCENILEPLLAAIKKKYPEARHQSTSGYRCPRVNTAIGGAHGSQHEVGEANDNELYFGTQEKNLLLAQLVLEENLDFDQMILEYGPSMSKPEWIHLSYDPDKPKQRGMILRYEYKPDPTDSTKQIVKSYQTTRATVMNLKQA